MSSRKAKKIRQEVRRVVNANFGSGMAALSNIVRQRPWFIPRLLWIILYLPLFKHKYIPTVFKHLK
jgi:hypothetical protein